MVTTPHPNRLPSLAGIADVEEASVAGLPVDDNVNMLKRIHYVKKRLYDTMIRHLNRTPEWEAKGAFSLHIWLDAEHVAAIRKRVSEMREPPLHLDKAPDDKLERLMDELLRANTTTELLSGLWFVRSSLLRAYRAHRALTNPLVDHPTCRMLKLIAVEEEETFDWLAAALDALVVTDRGREERRAWFAHLYAYLRHARGILGNEPEPTADEAKLPEPRAAEPFANDFVPRRDDRFADLHNSVLGADEAYADRGREPKERVWALLYKRLREIDVPEMMCSIVAETPDKPWDYYVDMGRQIWDEARHSMMGEVAFAKNGVDWTRLPIRINFSLELNTMLTPDERHAVLYDIEFGLMPGDTGKKHEWETAKASGYGLAVTFHDYDWADEVLHAQIGRKWIVPQLGGVQETLATAKRAFAKLAGSRPDYESLEKDWWERFYAGVKDRPFAT
ncbi:hypothetical protein [Paenibacillus flagellatus]|uniref:Uncharacterized protein n=1 Tax=Paenibacillus flagellatus TaxID=2211139 RepID=A0A2V5KEL1_9BACL|nr:hypothetical protein [Paenibacillus flagellatus]PYI56573.1 hypothetical protein DLM86_06290 [Paenibacillus flagellatus]